MPALCHIIRDTFGISRHVVKEHWSINDGKSFHVRIPWHHLIINHFQLVIIIIPQFGIILGIIIPAACERVTIAIQKGDQGVRWGKKDLLENVSQYQIHNYDPTRLDNHFSVS